MSRSIHATRAALARLEAEEMSRPRTKQLAVAHARAELERKRAVKAFSRKAWNRPAARPAIDVESIPVQAEDEGPFVHHPAGVDVVRVVLLRLPRGVVDGLAGVSLRLGREVSEEMVADSEWAGERDPFTGRAGGVTYPGVWHGRLLGVYWADAARIELYGSVFDPAHPRRDVWMPLLRLNALATLAHEVAHHHDHTCRVARGRWLARDDEAVERYAEAMQHRWTHEVVVPFLRERYGDEVAQLERWIELHGGIALAFEEMMDDPRVTGRGGVINPIRAMWTMQGAVALVLESMDRGDPAWKTRLIFGRQLHFQDRFAQALQVVDGVLRERPHEREAALDRADVLQHLERHEEALGMSRALAAEDAECEESWRVVTESAAELGLWDEALAAATRRLQLVPRGEFPPPGWVLDRAEIRLSAGDLAGARLDLGQVEAVGRAARKRAERLRIRIDAAEAGRPDPEETKETRRRRSWRRRD
jgi:tetratricopeptide (TPR) repeat protein